MATDMTKERKLYPGVMDEARAPYTGFSDKISSLGRGLVNSVARGITGPLSAPVPGGADAVADYLGVVNKPPKVTAAQPPPSITAPHMLPSHDSTRPIALPATTTTASPGVRTSAPVVKAAAKKSAATATAAPIAAAPESAPLMVKSSITDLPRDVLNQSIAGYEPDPGGGIATDGENLIVMRGRTPAEETKFRAEQTAQPITAMAAAPQQTSTVGYGQGVFELAPGQNAPPDFSTMSLGDMAAYKFGLNQQAKQAGIANVGSEISRRAAITQLETNAQPSEIDLKQAQSGHYRNTDRISNITLPYDLSNKVASNENVKSEIASRKGMLELANKKLALLTKQYDAHLAAMKTSGTTPDYRLMADISKSKIKTYQEMASLGGLTPEQQLDLDKHIKNLDIIQRNATKTTTQYGNRSNALSDDET